MKRHRFLVGFAVLFVSLLVTTKAPAKESNFDAGQHNASKGVVFMNHEEVLRIAKSMGLKVHIVKFVKLSKHDLEKLGKLSSKGCGCAVPEDEEFFGGGGCFKSCLKDWGVNYATITACAAACGVSLVSCAICVGVGEWIVMGCSLSCAWAPYFSKNVESAAPATPKLSRTLSTHVAKLSLRAAHSGLSR